MSRLEEYLWMVQTGFLAQMMIDGKHLASPSLGGPAISGIAMINDALREFNQIPADYDLYLAAVKQVRFAFEPDYGRPVYD